MISTGSVFVAAAFGPLIVLLPEQALNLTLSGLQAKVGLAAHLARSSIYLFFPYWWSLCIQLLLWTQCSSFLVWTSCSFYKVPDLLGNQPEMLKLSSLEFNVLCYAAHCVHLCRLQAAPLGTWVLYRLIKIGWLVFLYKSWQQRGSATSGRWFFTPTEAWCNTWHWPSAQSTHFPSFLLYWWVW